MSTTVYVLQGAGSTVLAYPSSLHTTRGGIGGQGAPPRVAIWHAPRRRPALDVPDQLDADQRRRRDETALVVAGAI